ncbi:unnamed protein product [Fraxinus pennsylvanica]|uniref:Uncharacterized protein n=1 Tax=Fraxinus pennsylvanica TaxID=56036 RepID=A0AAD1ZR01_9LAMI|nr:unnamed protein product [Fraxinus pennsylvanica]
MPIYSWPESLQTDEVIKSKDILDFLTSNPEIKDQLFSMADTDPPTSSSLEELNMKKTNGMTKASVSTPTRDFVAEEFGFKMDSKVLTEASVSTSTTELVSEETSFKVDRTICGHRRNGKHTGDADWSHELQAWKHRDGTKTDGGSGVALFSSFRDATIFNVQSHQIMSRGHLTHNPRPNNKSSQLASLLSLAKAMLKFIQVQAELKVKTPYFSIQPISSLNILGSVSRAWHSSPNLSITLPGRQTSWFGQIL